MNKVRELPELKSILESAKSEGKQIVFANGCFDILHVGHVRYLREARALVDQNGRAILLASLECVDHIVMFDDDTVDRLLIELKPHLHCKGGDYTPDTVPEKETVKQYGGATSITGGRKVQSTRWLFEEIRRRHSG